MDLQHIDKDSNAGSDKHVVCIDHKVPINHSLNCFIQQHSSQHPDDEDRHYGTYHLCKGEGEGEGEGEGRSKEGKYQLIGLC